MKKLNKNQILAFIFWRDKEKTLNLEIIRNKDDLSTEGINFMLFGELIATKENLISDEEKKAFCGFCESYLIEMQKKQQYDCSFKLCENKIKPFKLLLEENLLKNKVDYEDTN